ncbi:VOC family protein [Kitasatospora gansuensis]
MRRHRRRPEPKTVKNRVHLDLATTSTARQTELVARLKDLGATLADVGQGDVPWTVMSDPEGSEFCLLTLADPGHGTGAAAGAVTGKVRRDRFRATEDAVPALPSRRRAPSRTRSPAIPSGASWCRGRESGR